MYRFNREISQSQQSDSLVIAALQIMLKKGGPSKLGSMRNVTKKEKAVCDALGPDFVQRLLAGHVVTPFTDKAAPESD